MPKTWHLGDKGFSPVECWAALLWTTLALWEPVVVNPVVRHAAVPPSNAASSAEPTGAPPTVQASGQQTSAYTEGSTSADERIVVQEGEHLIGLTQRYLAKPQTWREWAIPSFLCSGRKFEASI
ncbi:hypothetical protein [Limnohabitans sp.]|uniref:hypothetical protein n=1 Tax=Limnohabitans sp. TaxID=1907725 RepID=UPI00286F06B5|nr:hypothetical protein [Limnohabitans sp.]